MLLHSFKLQQTADIFGLKPHFPQTAASSAGWVFFLCRLQFTILNRCSNNLRQGILSVFWGGGTKRAGKMLSAHFPTWQFLIFVVCPCCSKLRLHRQTVCIFTLSICSPFSDDILSTQILFFFPPLDFFGTWILGEEIGRSHSKLEHICASNQENQRMPYTQWAADLIREPLCSFM